VKKDKKKIDTLVDDINDLFRRKVQVDRKIINKYTRLLGDTIQEAIEQSEDNEKQHLRMSLLGMPDRKLYYTLKNPPSSTVVLSPETRIKFLYGHTVEALVLALAEIAGHEVTRCQEVVELNGVKGHIDGFIDGVLVDVKSASSYGFKKYQGNNLFDNDPFGNIMQLSGYAQALGVKEAAFLAVNKESGELRLFRVNELELENASKRIDNIRDFLKESKPPAERCYSDEPFGKKGNRVLKRECSEWCSFREQCWGNKLRKFQYSDGVKYFTKVKVEPRVDEIK
jgi:hypothetical protein